MKKLTQNIENYKKNNNIIPSFTEIDSPGHQFDPNSFQRDLQTAINLQHSSQLHEQSSSIQRFNDENISQISPVALGRTRQLSSEKKKNKHDGEFLLANNSPKKMKNHKKSESFAGDIPKRYDSGKKQDSINIIPTNSGGAFDVNHHCYYKMTNSSLTIMIRAFRLESITHCTKIDYLKAREKNPKMYVIL